MSATESVYRSVGVGLVFGESIVLRQLSRDAFVCRCSCGRERTITKSSIWGSKSGLCRSCKEMLKVRHGMSKTKEYQAWRRMKERCYNKNHHKYATYGARGITVCDRWLEKFENFSMDMGDAPSGDHSIERINNNLGYSPSNCKWATRKEQQRNMRSNRIAMFHGERICISELAEKIGISTSCLTWRLNNGWTMNQIENIRSSDRHLSRVQRGTDKGYKLKKNRGQNEL